MRSRLTKATLEDIKHALIGEAPYPLSLRKYLLATGERGLGMAYVERMAAVDFEYAWQMMQLVNQASTEDGREEIKLGFAADVADKIDAGEVTEVDPNTMTPEELEAWAQEWQLRHYNQQL